MAITFSPVELHILGWQQAPVSSIYTANQSVNTRENIKVEG